VYEPDKAQRTNQILATGVENWELYRYEPGWVRDYFAEANHYTHPDGSFNVSEVILAEAFLSKSDFVNDDSFFLSLFVAASNAAEEQKLDLGFGAFRRPNRSGSLVFINSTHLQSIRGRGPYQVLSTRLQGDFVRARLSELWQTTPDAFDPLFRSSFFDSEIELWLSHLWAVVRGAPFIVSAKELIDLILGSLLEKAGHAARVSTLLKVPYQRAQVQKAINYISQNFQRKISRSESSHASGIHEKELSNCFRAELGMTPSEYIKRFRLNRVRELLENAPDLSLQQIARRCGFYDARDLYPIFEQTFGKRPSAFREDS